MTDYYPNGTIKSDSGYPMFVTDSRPLTRNYKCSCGAEFSERFSHCPFCHIKLEFKEGAK
jgi:hypothetical protein